MHLTILFFIPMICATFLPFHKLYQNISHPLLQKRNIMIKPFSLWLSRNHQNWPYIIHDII